MNAIRLITLLITNNVRAVAQWSKENVTHTLRTLYLAIVIPVILIVAGVLLSWAGDPTNQTAIGIGKALVVAGGLLNAVLLFIFWARSVVLSYVFLIATKGVDLLPKIDIPEVHRDDVEQFLWWIRSWNTWVMGAALYAMVFPVHRNLLLSGIVVMTWFIIASMMSARWFGGERSQRVLAVVVVMIFLGATALQIFPEVAPQTSAAIDGWSKDAQVWNNSRTRMQEIERGAMEDRTVIEATLLAKLRAEQNGILKCAALHNRGKFCNPKDAKRYAEIQKQVEELTSGKYWESISGKALPRTKPTPVPAPTVTKSNSSSGTAAPARPVVSSVKDLRRKPVRKPAKKLPKRKLNDVFSELDKYDDL